MFVSRKRRKFHDPWGNKHYNRCGSPIKFQYMVSEDAQHINKQDAKADVTNILEGTFHKYVIAAKNVEKIRR